MARPDKAPLLGEQPTSKPQSQKFIKPITNKWVPINAKVILPSSRNSSGSGGNHNQKHNRNRKRTPTIINIITKNPGLRKEMIKVKKVLIRNQSNLLTQTHLLLMDL